MEKEQYEILLAALADKIKAQDKEICLQKWQIENLKKELATSENFLNPTKGEAKPAELEIR